jgi:HK97 family phage portal protein
VYDLGVRWTWGRRKAPVNGSTIDVNSPAFAQFLQVGRVDLTGVTIDEASALGLSAMFRAVSLVSGTLGSLPLRSLRSTSDGASEQVASVFDDPDGPDGQTQFEWTETLFAHLMIHGKAGALKVRNQAGGLIRLPLVHPLSFRVEEPVAEEFKDPSKLPAGGLWFIVTLDDATSVKMDADDFWYVPAMTMNGTDGMGLLQVARMSLGTSIAGDESAARMFGTGATIAGLASPEDDLEPDEVTEIKRALDNSTTGIDNTGKIAVVNRRLKFTPWTMTAVDAQFLQSRQFQIEEISRWTGVPPHLLMQTEKQTSWGTGVEEQNRALGRTVLAPWACRLEGRGSRLLANPRRLEIDFAGLERPSPDREIELLLKQTGGKPIMTVNEARATRGLAPVPGGDTLDTGAAGAGQGDPSANPE